MDAQVAVLGSGKFSFLGFVRDFLLRPNCDGDGVADQRYLERVGRRYQRITVLVRLVSIVENIQR